MDPIKQVIKVAGKDALAELNRLRKEAGVSKLHPFLVGTDKELDQLRAMINPPSDGGAEILANAEVFDVEKWLAEKAPKSKVTWPKKPVSQNNTFLSMYDLSTRQLKPEINIILVEAAKPWEVFATLGYGDWNDCPAPHIHVAVHKYWAKKFKSCIVTLSSDVVECFVLEPTSEKGDTSALAREQYTYCYDIVEQGAGTIGKLASALLGAKYWYFWWD